MNISKLTTLIGAHRYGNIENNVEFVLTDSRSLCFPEETIFFAIKTQRNDGHNYISELYRRGVRNFTVQELPAGYSEAYPGANFLKVPNTLAALQRLAERCRDSFNIPIIGITGSNGKTTVKEWLYQILSKDYFITRSPRSFNSQVGVPLSVWLLNDKSEIGIFEAGISMPGEMDALQEIIQPTIAILTNIGVAHQENFRSLREKCEEKLRLFRDAQYAVYCADDETISHCIRKSEFHGKKLSWSQKDEDVTFYVKEITTDDSKSETTIEYIFKENNIRIENKFSIHKISEGAIENSIICAIVCLHLGIDAETLAKRMLLLEAVAMRLEVKEGQRGCTLINDSYNNDIKSLDIALDFMARRPEHSGLRRTLILSDIQQSGLSNESLAKELMMIVKNRGVEKFIGIGPNLHQYFAPVLCSASSDILRAFYDTTEEFLRSSSFKNLKNEIILIKGARDFCFEEITDRLEKKVHETVLDVNLNAIIENFNYYRSLMHPETKLTCMVKADAYGAGAVEVAKVLQDHRVDYLAVAVADEGVTLRKAGITSNIIIMNPEMSAFKTMFNYNLEPEVYSFRLLEALIHAARHEGITDYPIHIKLDTGMSRLGFNPNEDIDHLIDVLHNQKALIPRSVFSHFVGSDSDNFDEFSAHQFALYDKASKKILSAFPHRILRHICNSAGIEHFPQYHMDMCRLGLGLYGINPRNNEKINTVSTLKTTILQIHNINKGESIGYSRKTILQRDSRIAAIPIGYADGLDRLLGNRNGYCLVNGQRADYVGNICMDVAMIDVTDINCSEGDSVEIFGDNLPVTTLSNIAGTIPYEILTGISSRVKRIYYKE